MRGSIVVPVPKKSGSIVASQHRPVQLQRLERKVCGQYLLSILRDYIKIAHTQHCLGPKAGVDPALFTLTQLMAHYGSTRTSTCVYFVDLSAAYDTIVHDLVMGKEEHDSFEKMFMRLGGYSEDAERAAAYIKRHPDSVINSNLPVALQKVIRQWLRSWMITGHHWRLACHHMIPPGDAKDWTYDQVASFHPATHPPLPTLATSRGVKQGDPLSTLLFSTYMSMALDSISERFAEECELYQWQVIPQFEVPEDRQLLQQARHSSSTPESVLVPHLDYADDVAYILANRDPKIVMKAVKALVLATVHGFSDFGLKANMQPQKSALLLRFHGVEARGVWQYLKQQPSQQMSSTASGMVEAQTAKSTTLPLVLTREITIHITQQYPYLGQQIMANHSQSKEIIARKVAANTAFSDNVAVLTSMYSTIHVKIRLYKSLVMPHLIQQTHTTSTYTDQQIRQLECLHIHYLKKICRLHIRCPVEWFRIADDVLLARLGEPPLRMHIMARRLGFLRKMVTADDRILRAMCAISSKPSMWTMWFKDLELLKAGTPTLATLPAPNRTTFHVWLQFIIPADTVWPALLRHHTRHKAVASRQLSQLDLTALLDPYAFVWPDIAAADGPEQRDQHQDARVVARAQVHQDGAALLCDACGRLFGTRKGLLSHRRTAHNIQNPLSLRLFSNKCPTCNTQLGTRSQVLQHLANRPECSIPMMRDVEPMTEESFKASIATLNKQDTTFSRSTIPRRGPIPVINRVPQSQSEEPIDPFV
eukprot:6474448-Amphidinium_carterae.1